MNILPPIKLHNYYQDKAIIKLWWWRLRYCWYMYDACGCNTPIDFLWDCATAIDGPGNPYEEGMSPEEAVDSEMSYWE